MLTHLLNHDTLQMVKKLPKTLTTVTRFSKTLAFILFFTFPLAGFLLGMQYQQAVTMQSMLSEPQNSKRIPTPKNNPANWRTFINKKIGFSFSYPDKYKYLQEYFDNFKLSKSGSIAVQDYDGYKPVPDSFFQFYINIYENPNLSLDQYVNNLRTTIKGLSPNHTLAETSSEVINGVTAIRGQEMVHYQLVPAVWFKYKTYLFTVQMSTSDPNNIKIFNQILSTFKFADQPQSNTIYSCPKTAYVNCMPGPGVQKPECSGDYLKWAKTNCPGFQGGAL